MKRRRSRPIVPPQSRQFWGALEGLKGIYGTIVTDCPTHQLNFESRKEKAQSADTNVGRFVQGRAKQFQITPLWSLHQAGFLCA